MSNVIKLLETLGADARTLDSEVFQSLVRDARLTCDIEAALLSRDATQLAELLQAPPTVFCGLLPSENEEPADAPAEQPDEEPDQSASSQQAA